MDVATVEKPSAMIAFLPITTDWVKQDLPHMTLVFAGFTEDLGPTGFNELAKDASSIAQLSCPFSLKSMGVEQFGGMGYDTQVNVLKLQPTMALWAMRRFVERWNASEYDFTPHVTIGPVGVPIDYTPPVVAFDKVLVGFGEDYIAFNLKGSGSYPADSSY